MVSWEKDIVQSLQNLGGVASYEDIYSEVSNLRNELPKEVKK